VCVAHFLSQTLAESLILQASPGFRLGAPCRVPSAVRSCPLSIVHGQRPDTARRQRFRSRLPLQPCRSTDIRTRRLRHTKERNIRLSSTTGSGRVTTLLLLLVCANGMPSQPPPARRQSLLKFLRACRQGPYLSSAAYKSQVRSVTAEKILLGHRCAFWVSG
jgi:hypothetical protein